VLLSITFSLLDPQSTAPLQKRIKKPVGVELRKLTRAYEVLHALNLRVVAALLEPFEPFLQAADELGAAVRETPSFFKAIHLLAVDHVLQGRLRVELDIVDKARVEVVGSDKSGKDA
jgi:hypothetical protein